MKKVFLFLLLIILVSYLFPLKLFSAKNENSLPSITIINILRGKELGHENDDLFGSLKAQWFVTQEAKVNATWLWQYSTLEDSVMTDFAKKEMKNQEFGILFEIDRNYAQKSGVVYRGQGPWYFSDGLLLASYDDNERTKLIDNAFNKFKYVFGYYPKTVGAWWIGGNSISYMQEKYGITSVLKASDQFALDFYTIWGSPWSLPYLSSKENEGIPARSWKESAKVVILQWAARDPVKGYRDSTFSLQDYFLKGYDLSYVDYLLNTYLKNSTDNIVIGLENGGDLNVFNDFYKTMIMQAKKRDKEGKVKIVLAKDYANEFLSSKNILPQKPYVLSDAYDSNNQTLWYYSSNYRVFIEKLDGKIFLSDLRDYSKSTQEDFAILPNSQARLWVGEKYLIDSKLFPESKKLITASAERIKLVDNASETVLFSGEKKIGAFSNDKIRIFSDDKIIDYSFSKSPNSINPLVIIGIIYLLYFVFVYSITKNSRMVLEDVIIFFSILFLVFPFFAQYDLQNRNFLFDKKEQVLFYLFPFNFFLDLKAGLMLFKIVPLLSLILIHALFKLSLKTNIFRYIYYFIILIYVFIYFHLFYFPLNKTNLTVILFILSAILIVTILSTAIKFLRKKSNKLFIWPAIAIIFVVIFGISSVYSRAKHIITPFEIEALQIVKDQNKDVIYVSQEDYGIKPIYKAVKPLLFDNLTLAQNLTGVNWTNVLRPEDDILKLSDFRNQLIFIPRYLGSDLSDYEVKSLKVTKIFDNLQIAIYKAN